MATPEQIAAARKRAAEIFDIEDVDGPDFGDAGLDDMTLQSGDEADKPEELPLQPDRGAELAPFASKLQEGDELGQPEGKGLAQDELEAFPTAPPMVRAPANAGKDEDFDLAGYDRASEADAQSGRVRQIEGIGKQFISDLLGTPKAELTSPPGTAVKAFGDRGKMIRDWLGAKQNAKYKDAMANRMNAPRAVSPPKPPPLPKDPLDVDLDRQRKQAAIDQIKANIAAKRAPKAPKPPSEREKIARERFDRQKLQSEVPGFEEADPAHPHPLSSTDATELRKAATNRDVVLNGLKRLEDIRKANPHAVPSSEAMAEMKAIIAEMQGSIAGVNDFQLTQGHQELQHAMLDDPAAAVSYVNSGRLEKQIDALRHSVNASIASRAARMQRREVGLTGGGGGQSAETKVIGGKTYVKQGDRWVLK